MHTEHMTRHGRGTLVYWMRNPNRPGLIMTLNLLKSSGSSKFTEQVP